MHAANDGIRITATATPPSYIRQIETDGYSHIPGSLYLKPQNLPDLKALQESYFRLPEDADGGQRFRAYKRFTLHDDQLRETADQGYSQSRDYNYTEGGKTRSFQPIEPSIWQLPFLHHVVETDAQLVRQSGFFEANAPVDVALHQVRYQPTEDTPSFSSPPWLHKDDEPAVFVHLVNLSANLTGGDSVLATGRSEFQRVLRLSSPFDTLFLSQKLFHAVTPVGISAGIVGFRDILIVTFKNLGETKLAA